MIRRKKTQKIPIILITKIIWIPMTECTGLINHGIDSREQWESFRQIFDFMPVPESQDLTDKQD